MLTESISEKQFQLLRVLETNVRFSQRQLAKSIGVSLGSINYCLGALVDKGFVKIDSFMSNPEKPGYVYLLIPKGVHEKSKLTVPFLERKQKEHVKLQNEIKMLRDDLDGDK